MREPSPLDRLRTVRDIVDDALANEPTVLPVHTLENIRAAIGTVAKRDTTRRDPFSPAHARLLYVLGEAPATDTQLIRRYGIRTARPDTPWPFLSDAGLRSRRAELVRWGFVTHNGDVGRTRSDRASRIWALAPQFPLLPTEPSPRLPAALAALSIEAGNDMLLGLLVARIAESFR